MAKTIDATTKADANRIRNRRKCTKELKLEEIIGEL